MYTEGIEGKKGILEKKIIEGKEEKRRMGRGKIDIKLIENINNRQVTFSKRRAGLLKKANELSVLCDAEVAVIIFSSTGRLFEFSSTSMKQTIARYQRCIASTETSARGKKLEDKEQPQPLQSFMPKQEHKEVDSLKDELSKLKIKQLRLLGKDLNGMGLNELRQLEHQLNEGLLSIKDRKEELLLQQLEHSRRQEERATLESDTLRKQLDELRGLLPLASLPPPYLEYQPLEKKYSILKEGEESLDSDTACEDGVDDEDSNTTLQLGLPTMVSRKRKKPEVESPSSNSENQVGSK